MAVEIGAILEGKVTGITNFGAFVELPDKTTGMVHISEVSSTFIKDIHEKLSEGDVVKVKVLEINEKGKVSLSIKKALPKEEKPRPQKPSKPRRDNNDRGWKGAPQHENSAPMSFEDMMAKFKAQSEDKMSDLKRMSDKRGGNTGYRRGSKQ